MTDEQYYNLMCQMYDLALLTTRDALTRHGFYHHHTDVGETLARMSGRCAEVAPVTTLAQAKSGETYCVTGIEYGQFFDKEYMDCVIEENNLTLGSLIVVAGTDNSTITINVDGNRARSMLLEAAELISVVPFPDGL